MRPTPRWLALWLAVVSASAAGAQAERVVLRLQPEDVGVGEPVELTFELPSATGRAPQMAPRFELDNLRVLQGPSRQDSLSWIQGVVSRRTALSWVLTAKRPGPARVYGIAVTLGDETITFPDRVLAIAEERSPPAHPRRLASDPFEEMFRGLFGPPRARRPVAVEPPELRLQAEAVPAQPYAGQQTIYTLYLLTERRRPGEGRVQVETIYPRKLPTFAGFWVQEVPLPEHSRIEMVEHDGRTYFRQPVLRRALFPLREGPQVLDSAEVELRLVTLVPTLLGEEPLRPSSTARASAPLRLQVRALPPAPAGFSGAVGAFRFDAGLAPKRLAAGEASTLTLRLEGTGNLASVSDPELPPLPGVRRLPPRQESGVEPDGSQLRSRRTWAWPLIPEGGGSWELPPLEWIYFDPVSGSYRTLRTRSLQLLAEGEAPAAAEKLSAAETEELPAPAAPGEAWYAGAGLLPVAAGVAALAALPLGATLWRRRRSPRCRLQRQLLERLRAADREAQPRQTAAAAESAWRDYLAERWRIPRGTPCTQWDRALRDQGVSGDTASELVSLMDDLHYLRYAPQLATTAPLHGELLPRARRLLRQLR